MIDHFTMPLAELCSRILYEIRTYAAFARRHDLEHLAPECGLAMPNTASAGIGELTDDELCDGVERLVSRLQAEIDDEVCVRTAYGNTYDSDGDLVAYTQDVEKFTERGQLLHAQHCRLYELDEMLRVLQARIRSVALVARAVHGTEPHRRPALRQAVT